MTIVKKKLTKIVCYAQGSARSIIGGRSLYGYWLGMSMNKIKSGWQRLSLPIQFLIMGGFVMLHGMFAAGIWVSARFESAVVHNAAATASSFMEDHLTPLSNEAGHPENLDQASIRALNEIYYDTPIGYGVPSYRVWTKNDETPLYFGLSSLSGSGLDIEQAVEKAWEGTPSWRYEDMTFSSGARPETFPVLTVVTPIHRSWTGETLAVVAFHARADGLASDIHDARREAWLIMGAIFLGSGMLLFWIVVDGGIKIKRQQVALEERGRELEHQLEVKEQLLEDNERLRQRNISAAARTSAQTDNFLQQLGHELHDGPAQHIAVVSMLIEDAIPGGRSSPFAEPIFASLDNALQELRLISRGLALPDLETLPLRQLVSRICKDHQIRSGMTVDLKVCPSVNRRLDYPQKLCVYRFLQETLSNAFRHSGQSIACVHCTCDGETLNVSVHDDGIGFEGLASREVRPDGGQGLFSLLDRAEAIGGEVVVRSAIGDGSTFILQLPVDDIKNPLLELSSEEVCSVNYKKKVAA